MAYRNLQDCVRDLEQQGFLIRIMEPVDACLEAAEIHRRVYASGGPAVLFANVKNCRFPMVSNLFGSLERTRFIFRDTLETMRKLVELKIDPTCLAKSPWNYAKAVLAARWMIPKSVRSGPAMACTTTLDQLPAQKSWPDDGGPFVTLPLVYSEDVTHPGWRHSNLGMYRVQLSGNQYQRNQQVGLHYQIHRGIGVHHARALEAGRPLQVQIFVGGAPAMSVAAVMPLPEGMSELTVGGVLSGGRIPLIRQPDALPIYAEADFCISGEIEGGLLPEGPFGDHLGYYSLQHAFPVLRVKHVYHRPDAIWPFTVVGRPPQEDTMFGKLVHEISQPVLPTLISGLHSVHAVDASGVHPLLLAIGSERYRPYEATCRPMELLTQAHAILGQGQLSLAKYLMIVGHDDDKALNIQDITAFFAHLLCRVDWRRDLHFQTCTTIDTLDYSGSSLNEGSKVVIAAVGPPRRELATKSSPLPELRLFSGEPAKVACPLPGILLIQAAGHPSLSNQAEHSLGQVCRRAERCQDYPKYPLWILVDDCDFAAAKIDNLIWVTFTRSNPACDIDGIRPFVADKHWGCSGSLVIDARIKRHHAPPLVTDPVVASRVDGMAARGGPLARWL